MPEEVDKKEVFDLHDIHESEPSAGVSKKHVAEIIEARTEEIFKMVDKELERIDRSGLLPAGVVLTGGGAKLPGMVMLAKQLFKLPASVGISRDLITAIDHVADPSFDCGWTRAVGFFRSPSRKGVAGNGKFSAVGVTGKMKKRIQGLMPKGLKIWRKYPKGEMSLRTGFLVAGVLVLMAVIVFRSTIFFLKIAPMATVQSVTL